MLCIVLMHLYIGVCGGYPPHCNESLVFFVFFRKGHKWQYRSIWFNIVVFLRSFLEVLRRIHAYDRGMLCYSYLEYANASTFCHCKKPLKLLSKIGRPFHFICRTIIDLYAMLLFQRSVQLVLSKALSFSKTCIFNLGSSFVEYIPYCQGILLQNSHIYKWCLGSLFGFSSVTLDAGNVVV